jgi:hypothetical protein
MVLFTTHLFLGLVIGATASFVFPVSLTVLTVAAVAGAMLPDLDVLFEHRKTLHYPVVSLAASLFLVSATFLTTHFAVVAAAVFTFSVFLHCAADLMCNGIGPDPWKHDWEHGVYNHVTGEWVAPVRWLDYAGSTRDLSLMLALMPLPLLVYPAWIQTGMIAVAVFSILLSMFQPYAPRVAPDWFLRFYRERQDYGPDAEIYAQEHG